MVHQGFGFTFISQVLGTTPPHWGDGVVVISLRGPHLTHNIATAVVKGAALSRRARNFREIAAEFSSMARP